MENMKLNNNLECPMLGLGTFMLSPEDAYTSTLEALKMGYSLIDTANAYVNERAVGRAIKDSGIDRKNIFLSTKIWASEYENENTVEETLERLGVDYVDLLYIHQPAGNWLAGYRMLEKAYREGKAKSIGISNFEGKYMEELETKWEFLFGYLSEQNDILTFMRDEVSKDDNWRVQEVLAKAFDEFCKNTGYEKALPIIDEWLENDNPNTRRAVTEGLRIWTSRPYFKDNPNEAIRRIVALKEDPSEYVRKSVGNALRDISKKFPELIKDELNNWKLESKEINQVYKLASKLIN